MLKNIRPSKLRGLTDTQIERSLSKLFECDVEVERPEIRIYCVELYDDPGRLTREMRRLSNVGKVCVACNHGGPHVLLTLNAIAMSVIETTSINKQ